VTTLVHIMNVISLLAIACIWLTKISCLPTLIVCTKDICGAVRAQQNFCKKLFGAVCEHSAVCM